jgi:hypothetical protein
MQNSPIDNIGNDSVNIDWNLISAFAMKSDAAQRIILRNQARIIAKLEGLNTDELEAQFNKKVEEEIVTTFNSLIVKSDTK